MIKKKEKQKIVILSAGGSGGHIFPAEAVAEVLIDLGMRVILITDSRFANFKTGALSGVEIKTIKTGTTVGSLPKKFLGILSLALGIIQARFLLAKLKPNCVVGFGGYPSFPTIFSASSLAIPTIIHEQNSVLGRANRLLAGKVNVIATSFVGTRLIAKKDHKKIMLIGNPVRASIQEVAKIPYQQIAPDGVINILVTGGSQGASIFSEVVPQAVALLQSDIQSRLHIIQQCRQADVEKTRTLYDNIKVNAEIAAFFTDIPEKLARSHLVIARAGASTIFELAIAGRPAILVPLPTSMDNHQYHNATAFADVGGGWLISQDDFTAQSLAKQLEELINTPDILKKSAENARKLATDNSAEKLANAIITLL